VPTPFGVTLVEVYKSIGVELYKPYLRAQMETDMKAIAEGTRPKVVVFQECLAEMKKIFTKMMGHAPEFKSFFKN
jgi:DNA topoisomerase IA